MAAFRKAVEQGADMIELDVRTTGDGKLVVHHDRRLGRTSDGHGRVRDLHMQQIQSADAGSWFGNRFAGEQIPSLDDVLQWLPEDMGLNVEVKTDGDPRPRWFIAAVFAGSMRHWHSWSRLVVSSFDDQFLVHLRSAIPSVTTGVLLSPVRDAGARPSVLARRAGAAVFICSRSRLRKRHVRDARMHGLAVACYGVNTAEQFRLVMRRGVDAVMTDFPDRIVRYRDT